MLARQWVKQMIRNIKDEALADSVKNMTVAIQQTVMQPAINPKNITPAIQPVDKNVKAKAVMPPVDKNKKDTPSIKPLDKNKGAIPVSKPAEKNKSTLPVPKPADKNKIVTTTSIKEQL